MSQPRMVYPGQTVLVTRRTLRRRFLLRPDKQLNQLFLYLVAFFVQKFGAKLSAIQVMSDHYHMVLTDENGCLPDLLRELHRVLALCVKVLRKWDGPVWDPRTTSVVEILTPQAAAQSMVYTWLNVVRAGLVADPRDWPGVTTALEDVDGPAILVNRPQQYLNAKSGRWPQQLVLRIEMPPILAAMGGEGARSLLQAELERQLTEVRSERQRHGRKEVGAKRCEQVSPRQRATSWEPLRGCNPVLAAGRGCRDVLKQGIARLRWFRAAYRSALAHWKQGVRDVLFPYGTWWLVRHHGAEADVTMPPVAG